jgi:hypothetical protein
MVIGMAAMLSASIHPFHCLILICGLINDYTFIFAYPIRLFDFEIYSSNNFPLFCLFICNWKQIIVYAKK